MADEAGKRLPLDEVGTEPDPRFSLANERTYLAWVRTALALIALGLGVAQLLPPFDVPGGGNLLGIPLVLFGGVVAVVSLRRWERNERALRLGQPLVHGRLPAAMAIGVGVVAMVAVLLVLLGGEVS